MLGKVVKVSGPIVVADGMAEAGTSDIVRIGEKRILGEVFSVFGNKASILAWEDTFGLMPGEPVNDSGSPLSVELGPGLIGNIYDGIQRPLIDMRDVFGAHLCGTENILPLNRTRLWEFVPTASAGTEVSSGDVIGFVKESDTVIHKIMVPHGKAGVIEIIESGVFNVDQTVCRLKTPDGHISELSLMQKWPVHMRRPFARKTIPSEILGTGRRVIDSFFPVAAGGTAIITGPSGSGKSVLCRRLEECADADVVIGIVCGGRCSEAAELISDFTESARKPSAGSIPNRTIMIINTPDMPAAFREKSLFTGMTIAEYYRDMGLNTLVIADSLTNWAEAFCENSAYRGEAFCMERGPAGLDSAAASFFGRAGCIDCTGSELRRGSVTVIGTVSSDETASLSENAAVKLAGVRLNLERSDYGRVGFPAVNLRRSYSLFPEALRSNFCSRYCSDFPQNREAALTFLRRERELEDVVKMNGKNSISSLDKLAMETARMIREEFLDQDVFSEAENRASYSQQNLLITLILKYNALCTDSLHSGHADIAQLLKLDIKPLIDRAKQIPDSECAGAASIISQDIKRLIGNISKGGAEKDE